MPLMGSIATIEISSRGIRKMSKELSIKTQIIISATVQGTAKVPNKINIFQLSNFHRHIKELKDNFSYHIH